MRTKIENEVSEIALDVFNMNADYIERCVGTIYRHFRDNGNTWGFKEEPVTKTMIEETILDLIDTILESDEKIDCDEAGTGGIIVRLEVDEIQQNDGDEFDLTIMIEL